MTTETTDRADLSVTYGIDSIPLSAFNLTDGATFVTKEAGEHGFAVWIVVHVTRNSDAERVYVWARRGDIITEGPGDSVQNRSFDFDFCTPVALIGHCLNPGDPDDNDWGVNYPS